MFGLFIGFLPELAARFSGPDLKIQRCQKCTRRHFGNHALQVCKPVDGLQNNLNLTGLQAFSLVAETGTISAPAQALLQ
jgi:hypothetical protein